MKHMKQPGCHSGALRSSDPGIQVIIAMLGGMDSGFAPSVRPGMTASVVIPR